MISRELRKKAFLEGVLPMVGMVLAALHHPEATAQTLGLTPNEPLAVAPIVGAIALYVVTAYLVLAGLNDHIDIL